MVPMRIAVFPDNGRRMFMCAYLECHISVNKLSSLEMQRTPTDDSSNEHIWRVHKVTPIFCILTPRYNII